MTQKNPIEYFYRYQGLWLEINAVYRFLDKLNIKLKYQVEQIAFSQTNNVSGKNGAKI